MILRLFEELQKLDDVRFYPGADPSALAHLEEQGLALPGDLTKLLTLSNGIEAYGGYFRIFGISTSEVTDSAVWNRPDTWKFAWETRSTDFWCFAETAWGDQYAFSRESLNGNGDPKVFFLQAYTMTQRILASSFAEFFEKEFVRNARLPYDEVTIHARQKLGEMETNSQLVFNPSPLLGGPEDINNLQRMPARAAMIIAGDIATQLDRAADHQVLNGVQVYKDDLQRSRIRVIWG